MASPQKDDFREEDSSANDNDKDGFFSYFKRDKRQRIGSEEEKGRNAVMQKLGKLESDMDELKALKGVFGEIKELRAEMQDMFSFIKGVQSTLQDIEGRLLQHDAKFEAMNKKFDTQSEMIDNLRGKLQKTQDRVVDAESHVKGSKAEIVKANNKIQKLDDKTIDLGARGRRSNLIFHGINEGGDQENCLAKVKEFIKVKCKVQDDVVIEVAHRLGAKKPVNIGSRGNKPRPMIARFLNRGDRDLIKKTRRNLSKEDGFGISEDFPYEIRMGRKELIPQLIEAKENGKEAWITYPCKLFIDRKLFKEIDPKDFA